MLSITGEVISGVGEFRVRMSNYLEQFESVLGHPVYPGTINVLMDGELAIQEDFRIEGTSIDEPNQDLLLERCTINGVNAYRVRPLELDTGAGGHGDHVLEIICARYQPNCGAGEKVTVTFDR